MPRFDQSFSGLCEQNLQDTLQLKQRYLDAKAKRPPKAKDKKQPDQAGGQQPASIQSSVHVQQKFLKRPAGEEHDPSGGPQGESASYEPPVKLQCTTQQHANQNEGITKFSLEIVQQLEFTTSAANSQPQQISTNVTVKAHTNASVKSDVSSPKSSNPSTPSSNIQQKSNSNIGLDVGTLVECVKQEPDNDFADLDQCAAALEKDAAANGGAAFGGFSDLIGEDTNDEIITSDAFNDLISDISNYPELMKDFDFEDNKPESSASANGLKVEDAKDSQSTQQSVSNPSDPIKSTQSPLLQNQNYSPSPVYDNQSLSSATAKNNNRMVYPNLDFTKTELSPAAQTLKQMAEQHQHKNQMGLTYNPNSRVPNARSPYSDFQYNTDYGSPTNQQFKNSPNFPQPDLIKQEMIFQGNEFDAMKRKGPSMYKQQYSPYSSPNHGSPGYLPRTNSGNSGGSTPGGPFGGGTPPRPPSGHGGSQGATLQINQAQQLHISQQGHGHNIQVSAGQHLQLSGELKGNVSIATHQGLHFNQQQHSSSNNPSSQQQQSQSQSAQQNQMPPQSQSQMGGNGPQNVQNPHVNVNMSQHQSQNNMTNPMMSNSQQQQNPSSQHLGSQQVPMGNPMQGGGMQGMPGMGNAGMQGSLQGPGGMQGPGNMQGGMQNSAGMSAGGMQGNMGGMGGNNMMGGSPLHPGSMTLSDSYSMSQTQTINFTQQSLRQRANTGAAMGSPMAPNSAMNPMNAQMGAARMMNQQQQQAAMEQQQKLLQQQQMLRNQQQQQQQQAAAAAAMQQHMVRPPPPDYKTSAGMMQPRYGAGMRRMPHQPIPPSGPMMRPHNVYMLQQQQQHLATRNMYPRQQNPMAGPIEAMQQKTEWRHLLLSQQQNANFNNPMRPSFQQGFNMNPANNMQQMTALQHQQMRLQHGLSPGGLGSAGQQAMGQQMGQGQVINQGAGGVPMGQMGGMNQQMQLMQQQQNLMQQQQNSQMSMTSIHMQQSQSLSLNQSLQQHQQQNSINQLVNNSATSSNSLASFNPQAADFNLEFLDNLSASDSAPFTEQELLSSFDSDSGFNLDF